MKYIKKFEKFGYNTPIYDIREFFSNLKKISYYFEDYYKFNKLFKDIEIKINARPEMAYFGFTNESQFAPIINTVTAPLHKIFDMAVNNNYSGIYDYCNDTDNYFEKYGRFSYFKVETYMSREIARDMNFLPKPYYDIKFRFTYTEKSNMKERSEIIQKIIENSELNDKYNIKVHIDTYIEIKIIAKNQMIFNAEQLKEIEKAKEFGHEKYDFLKPMKDANDVTNKYNI